MANVTIDVNARVDGLQRQLANVTQDLNRFSQNASFAGGVLKGAFAELASAATIAGFGALIKGAIDAGDNLRDLSKTTGLAVEQLAGLKLAASQSGADLDSTANAINKLSQNIGKNGEKFRQLGIDARDPLEAFKQLADVFVSIEDPQTRAALASQALGKSWQEVAPLLSEGGKALGDMVEEGTKASNMTAEFASKADELNDSMALLNAKFQGIVVTLAGPILDGFLALGKYISDINDSAKEGQRAFDLFKFGIDGAVKVTAAAIDIFHRASLGIGALLDKASALASLDFNKFLKIDQQFSADIDKASASYEKLVNNIDSSSVNSKALARGASAIDSANEFARARDTRNELQHQLNIRNAINSGFKTTVGITGEELDLLKKQAAVREFIKPSGGGGGASRVRATRTVRPRATSRKTTIDEGLRVIEQLRREKALLEDSGRVAAAKYDTQFGSLSKISPLQKDQIIALNKELEANDKLKDKLKEVSDLKAGISEIATDPNIDLSSFNRGLEQLRVKLKYGIIDEKTFTELSGNLSKSFNENFVGEAKESLSELSEFGKEAARNMQDSFAEFLYDPFKDGVKGMLDSFLDFIRKAAAEAASQKLLDAAGSAVEGFDWGGLVGSVVGGLGGALGNIGNSVANAASSSVQSLSQAAISSGTKSFLANFKGYASGGDFAGGLRIVGEKGPELEATGSARIFSADQTRRILNSTNNQTTSNNNITINVSSDNGRIEARSLAQIQSAIGKSINRSASRNG